MVDNLIEKFNVRELSQKCVGGQELQQQRKAIQAISESTSVLLKKNVYKNYIQFIETAKEITQLESEMYQLSHLLFEQKSLLETLIDSTNFNESLGEEDAKRKQKEEEDRVRVLTSILEKVEGCTGLLEVKDRVLLYEGDILELDPVEYSIIHKTHAYLFSDSLMLTSWITNRRGPAKYKMYVVYNLNSMAVVNVRDLKTIERAFKILAYPDTRLFQCSSIESKKEWLDHLDQAKKAILASEKIKRESSQTGPAPNEEPINIDSPTTLFDEESIFPNLNLPDWFLESPEEIDVFIAERHFEDALELLNKCKEYCDGLDEQQKDSVVIDIKNKIENRKKNLIDVLMKELEVSPDKSLQGGLRAARRAVRLLIALNKTIQACESMLKLCTSIMKKELKCVKREGATILYIRQLGTIFYQTLLDVVEEFRKIFPESSACLASLVIWSNSELTHFMSHVIKQIFVPQSGLSIISECVSCLREKNSQLCNFGLDLQYQMDGMFLKPVTLALQDSRDKLIEAIKHRSGEEKWHLMNLSNKNNLNKLISEFNDLGLTSVHVYTRGDCWLELTSNTVAFTKSVMTLFEDCMKLYSSHLFHVIEDVLYEIFNIQFKVLQSAKKLHKSSESEAQIINKNVKFLLDDVLKLIEKNFENKTKISSERIGGLTTEYNNLKLGIEKPKPAPRSITKYSSEEFI
ncbi:exocyst complex component, putative [Pediculus humanus corporis]|uniref:Exocyst complex component 8 n=1 Tax=Pediculus humanus subsp. corporis TaxID=121224 RepID=E0VFG0_PEDHC|nr:exocyst complex component, putative [Pediculus humanus corporis]EEB12116.1 exocyst complex component, putative [Pediculus humanus corporis]